jgi:translation initiation factor IF-3
LSKDTILNGDIPKRIGNCDVRCMGEEGKQYGIVSVDEAMAISEKEGLDLVLIAENGNPPVTKVMDYGKYKYQQEKKLKEARKNQKQIDIKEIKLSVKIAQNDIDYKLKHARGFLEAGKYVKFRVFLKGREMKDPEAGVKVLRKVFATVEDIGDMDKEPRFEGRYVNMMVIPKK